MSYFDVFYLLFKSNADDVIKGNKAVEKSTKDTEQALKNTRDTTQEVGANFVKMAESVGTAIGAIGGLEILKTGVKNAIDLNTNLKVTAENLGMTAQQLRTAQEAAKQFGGTAEEGRADAIRMAQANLMTRQKERDPAKMMSTLRAYVMGMPEENRVPFLQQFGISSAGIRQLTKVGNGEFNAGWSTAADIAKGTNSAGDTAYAANKLANKVGGEQDSFFNRLLISISSPLDGFLKRFGDLISGTGAGAGAAEVIGGTTLAGWGASKVIKGLFKGGKAVKAATIAARGASAGDIMYGGATAIAEGATAVAGGLAFLGGGEILYGAKKLSDLWSPFIEAQLVKNMTKDLKMPAKPVKTGSGGDLGFWMSQGYTKEQAAGIMANMQAESGGNAGSVGDGGAAHGLFQWHEKRRQAIKAGTGIDINTASKADQMKAAAWEMKNGHTGFNDAYFRTLGGADQAGAYFATNFEHPANALAKSISRGKSALSIASSLSSASSGPVNVKIDKIEVVTQATDANAIATGISGALENKMYTALGFIASNVDNGQSR